MNTEIKDATGKPINLGDHVLVADYNGGALRGPYRIEAVKSVIGFRREYVAPVGTTPSTYKNVEIPQTKVLVRAQNWRKRSYKTWLSRFYAMIVVPAPVPVSPTP